MFNRRLSKPLRLFTKTISLNAYGDSKETETDKGIVWCELTPVVLSEKTTDDWVDNQITHTAICRWHPEIKNNSYFTYDGREFEIASIVNVGEAAREFKMELKEKLAT